MMLFFNGLGLGATVQFDPSIKQNTNAAARPGEVGVAPPKFNDAVWTRQRIDYGKNVLTARWERRIHEMQAQLLMQWSAYLQPAQGAQKMSCRIGAKRGFEQMLYPIGVTAALGVPFTIAEVKGKDSIVRDYTPDYDQRFEADFAIYATSQRLLAGLFSSGFWGGDSQKLGLSDGNDLYLDLVDPNRGIGKLAREKFGDRSIRDAMTSGEWTYNIDTFGMNPIPPTPEEITDKGGLRSYYERGGYLINFAVARGKFPAASVGLLYSTGYVLCDGVPAPTIGSASALKYQVFVTVGPSYRIELHEAERGLASKAVSAVASVMKTLESVICSSQDVLANISNTTLLADDCQDVNGKPCKKGSTGCYCIPPPQRAVSAVQAGNALVGAWCGRNTTITTQPGQQAGFVPPPPTVFNPPPPLGASMIPTWLLVLGGFSLGAVAFTKR